MVHIVFEYRDEFCKDGKFRRQECYVRSLEECKQIYGLDECEHRIISIEECQVMTYIVGIYDIKETGGYRTFKTPHHYIAQEGCGFGGLTIFTDRAKMFSSEKDAEKAAAYYRKYPTCYDVSILKL